MFNKLIFWIKLIVWLRAIAFFLFSIVRVEYKPIIIHSEKLMNIISQFNGFEKEKAKAAAFFPFIILRYHKHPMNDTWIQHETIHHYQSLESLYLMNIYWELEKLYARHILWYDHMNTYLYQSIEQEAYLNQENPDYLKNRKTFWFWKHMFNKKSFTLVNYKVTIKK